MLSSVQAIGWAGSPQSPPTLQALTPARLNAETPPIVSGLQWMDNLHVAGNVKVGKETTRRTWSLTGAPSGIAAMGESRNSPDGTRIVTLENDEWIVRETTGARRVLARVPAGYGKNHLGLMVWSRDSRKIALVEEARAQPEPPDTVSVANGVRYVDVGAQAEARDAAGMFTSTITVLDLNTPESPRRFPYAGRLQSLEWGSADDLYFVTQRFWGTGGEPLETVVRALRGGESHDVFRVGGIMQGIAPRISPDGRWMSVTCDIDSQIWDDFTSLLIVELATGKVRRLTNDQYVIGGSVRWAPDSHRLYYTVRDGGWAQIHRADLDGRSIALTDSPTLKQEMQLSPDGQQLAYLATDGLARVDLRLLGTRANHDRRVASLNDPTTRFRLGRFERVKFPTADGLQLAAWVIYPAEFDSRKKYPLFVDVHGGGPGSYLYLLGPLSGLTARGPLEWHTWATKGYVVFVPDYRSSGEYGAGIASARHHNGDYGGIEADMRDIDAGTEWMSKQPYIDTSRIGVLGSSAGGARVNLLLTRSTRYRAGVIHDEIGAGVLPEFLNSLTGPRTGSTGTTMFWQTRVGNLADHPKDFLGGFLFDGYKSKTPTLIMIGGDRNQDLLAALDPTSAEVLFSILRQNHVPARMLRYLDDGHGFQTQASANHAF
ncbi:MAG: prolyl oligopeptidase family serine peptidase, partial [Gammaproteobacteria bacterium]